MSENMINTLVPVLVAVISMIGTITVAYFQFKGNREKRKNEETAEAERKAKEAEEARNAAVKELEEEKKRQQLESLDNKITELNTKLMSVSRGIKLVSDRVEKMHVRTSGRTAELEAKVAQMIELLSKYAQTYSTIVRYYDRTNKRFDQLVGIENSNLKYTVASVDAIEALVQIMRSMHDDGDHPDELQKLDTIAEQIRAVKCTFVESMMDAGVKNTESADDEVNRLAHQKSQMKMPPTSQSGFGDSSEREMELNILMDEIVTGVDSMLHELTDEC